MNQMSFCNEEKEKCTLYSIKNTLNRNKKIDILIFSVLPEAIKLIKI